MIQMAQHLYWKITRKIGIKKESYYMFKWTKESLLKLAEV